MKKIGKPGVEGDILFQCNSRVQDVHAAVRIMKKTFRFSDVKILQFNFRKPNLSENRTYSLAWN